MHRAGTSHAGYIVCVCSNWAIYHTTPINKNKNENEKKKKTKKSTCAYTGKGRSLRGDVAAGRIPINCVSLCFLHDCRRRSRQVTRVGAAAWREDKVCCCLAAVWYGAAWLEANIYSCGSGFCFTATQRVQCLLRPSKDCFKTCITELHAHGTHLCTLGTLHASRVCMTSSVYWGLYFTYLHVQLWVCLGR